MGTSTPPRVPVPLTTQVLSLESLQHTPNQPFLSGFIKHINMNAQTPLLSGPVLSPPSSGAPPPHNVALEATIPLCSFTVHFSFFGGPLEDQPPTDLEFITHSTNPFNVGPRLESSLKRCPSTT